ncbi:hypothetical protein P691DRAFT_809608 [Macrolepiota fuliginosa MF-IS2]|uniref:Uncharacterized protein n=1 Tax=Macrolepiota fuliginosa MF-IS2 TaxID=1400762 RepID=A0A9P6C3J6_9AGAR|nr:hypothetical protein P691DRAFT_809608 [Macrolepiota fuliginosa MF-IS2]
MASSTPTPTPTAQNVLLPLIIPHLTSVLRNSAHLALALPVYAYNLLTYIPWTTLISPVTYLLAPLTTFIYIILGLTLYTPYQFISWLIRALFPLYVFCGVACITGGLLGLGGRILSASIVRVVSDEIGYGHYEETKNADVDVAERSAKRRRLDKKDRVKFGPF